MLIKINLYFRLSHRLSIIIYNYTHCRGVFLIRFIQLIENGARPLSRCKKRECVASASLVTKNMYCEPEKQLLSQQYLREKDNRAILQLKKVYKDY